MPRKAFVNHLSSESRLELEIGSNMTKQVLMSSQSDSGPPQRSLVGTLLMLPIGLIIVVVLFFFFFANREQYFPGELLLIFLVIFLVLFVIRSAYWSSRRKHWRERFRENEPISVLRLRYARGEITKDQFNQMMRDLEQKP